MELYDVVKKLVGEIDPVGAGIQFIANLLRTSGCPGRQRNRLLGSPGSVCS